MKWNWKWSKQTSSGFNILCKLKTSGERKKQQLFKFYFPPSRRKDLPHSYRRTKNMLSGIIQWDSGSRQRKRYGHYLGQKIAPGLTWLWFHLLAVSLGEAELKYLRQSRNLEKLRKNRFTSTPRATAVTSKICWSRQPVFEFWLCYVQAGSLWSSQPLETFLCVILKGSHHQRNEPSDPVPSLNAAQFSLLKFNPNCLTHLQWNSSGEKWGWEFHLSRWMIEWHSSPREWKSQK